MKQDLLHTTLLRRETLQTHYDNMRDDGAYVLMNGRGEVVPLLGCIHNQGKLVPISPRGNYARFATIREARETLRELERLNPENESIVDCLPGTESEAFAAALNEIDSMLDWLELGE